MKFYVRSWTTMAVLAGAVGAVLGLIGVPAEGLIVAAVSGALLASALRFLPPGALRPASDPRSMRGHGITVGVGASVGVMVVGWISGAGLFGLMLVAVVTLSSPPVLAVLVRGAHSGRRTRDPGAHAEHPETSSHQWLPEIGPSQTEARTPAAGEPGRRGTGPTEIGIDIDIAELAATWSSRLADVGSCADKEVVLIWRTSYPAVLRCRTSADLSIIAEVRRRALDELQRRDPEGFDRWIPRARAASDPSPFLTVPRQVERDS